MIFDQAFVDLTYKQAETEGKAVATSEEAARAAKHAFVRESKEFMLDWFTREELEAFFRGNIEDNQNIERLFRELTAVLCRRGDRITDFEVLIEQRKTGG